MRLHNRVRNERREYLLSTEPTAIQSIDGFFCCIDTVKLDIYFSLENI